jgi:serine phosphatase RsbU (regulator of sigma subunit)/streptogramin lyase
MEKGVMQRILSFIMIGSVMVISAGSSICDQPYQPKLNDPLMESWRWQFFPELSGQGIRCMAETKDGSVWFGVEDGVIQYDGLHWNHYTEKDSLLGAPVFGLCAANDGRLYALTNTGVHRFDQGVWDTIFYWPFAFDKTWRQGSVIEASDGSIWAGLMHGAVHVKNERLIFYTTDRFKVTAQQIAPHTEISVVPQNIVQDLTEFSVYDICEDQEGNMWLFLHNGEIIIQYAAQSKRRQESSRWRLIKILEGSRPKIHQTRDGRVWILSDSENLPDQGVWVYDPSIDELEYINLQRLGGDHSNMSILETKDNALWIGGLAKLHVLKKDKWAVYHAKQLPFFVSARVMLHESSDDALWIVGYRNKALRVDYGMHRWATFRDLNFHCETAEGVQWFISKEGKIVSFSPVQNVWWQYGVGDGIMDTPMVLIAPRRGGVWAAGSHEGNASTAYFNGSEWIHRQQHPHLSWKIDYRTAFETVDGSIWFGAGQDYYLKTGARGGVIRCDAFPVSKEQIPQWQHFAYSDFIYGIGQTPDGLMWLPGQYLMTFNGQEYNRVEEPEQLWNHWSDCIHVSPEGNIWIGTRSFGVFQYRFREKIWEQYSTEDGLASNTITAIAGSSDSSIWVATDVDISYFDGRDWTTHVFPSHLAMSKEGGSIKQCRNGTLWINISSREWNNRSTPGVAHTERHRGDYFTLRYRPDRQSPETNIEIAAEKVSQPGNTVLSWKGFDVWRSTPTEKLQYSYRLDQGEWSPFTHETSRTFLALDDGNHVFEVKARDLDFNIDPTPARIAFTVIPPVWKQIWFIGLMMLFSSAVVFQTIRVIRESKKLYISNVQLKQEVGVRKKAQKELSQKNKELETMDSVVRIINKEIDLENVLQSLLRQSLNLLPQADKGSFLIYDEDTKKYRFKVVNGYNIEDVENIQLSEQEVRSRYTENSEQLEEGVYIIRNIKRLYAQAKFQHLGSPKSMLAMSVILEGRLEGFLILDNMSIQNAFDETDVQKLLRFREHAVSAFIKAKSLQLLEEKNQNILSSIRYGERIQNAILPLTEKIRSSLPEHFILFKPRDIVSGDFYWFNCVDEKIALAVVDCTGHGVPGAFMSMLGNAFLNKIVTEQKILDPSLILKRLHEEVRTALKQEQDVVDTQDGMDVCICVLEQGEKNLAFAGAKRPLYIVRNGEAKLEEREFIEINGDRKSIGGKQREARRVFTNHKVRIRAGDVLYLTTDGFIDQNDPGNKRYGSRRFKALLQHCAGLSLSEQREALLAELDSHQGKEEQRDDITVVGLRM